MDQSETTEFWLNHTKEELAPRVAALHTHRRKLSEDMMAAEIRGGRAVVGQLYLSGSGVELGSGATPFPLPQGTRCRYGDVRNHSQLTEYFGTKDVSDGEFIDAQTMEGVPLKSLDFVIAAHVIEHLYDPIGAIRASINTLKPGGTLLIVVPEMEKTWDRGRPPTTLEHVLADSRDGGESTRLHAYIEHAKYVHPVMTGEHFPEDQLESLARAALAAGMDIHVHAWRARDFREMLDYLVAAVGRFTVEAQISGLNENMFVMRRLLFS